ncbi:hypothetical protein BD311DRAFT_838761, partial [Dichomitus squalens]
MLYNIGAILDVPSPEWFGDFPTSLTVHVAYSSRPQHLSTMFGGGEHGDRIVIWHEGGVEHIRKDTQKEPWLIKMNPNGFIPVLVDGNRDNFSFREQHYDLKLKFSFDPRMRPDEYNEMLQWIFTHGGIGPMQGQANHFLRAAPEDIPYAKKRAPPFRVPAGCMACSTSVSAGATGSAVAAGRTASQISARFPGNVNSHGFTGIESIDEWPHVKAWLERTAERPAVKSGMQVPRQASRPV